MKSNRYKIMREEACWADSELYERTSIEKSGKTKMRGGSRRRRGYKALQLSKQARRALSMQLDEIPEASNLAIKSVEPDGSGNLIVIAAPGPGAGVITEAEALETLKKHQGYMRAVLAQSIHRKRTPNLLFRFEPGEW